eukprot:353305-Chlamydomonas_euryale.AAC.1
MTLLRCTAHDAAALHRAFLQERYAVELDLLDALLASLAARVRELSPEGAAGAVRLLPAALARSGAAAVDTAVPGIADELLAVTEEGLPGMSAAALRGVAEALGELGHAPDDVWTRALFAE